MLRFLLPKKAVKAVSSIVSSIFDRAKKRFLGKEVSGYGIKFIPVTHPVQHRQDLSLRGIFDSAARAEGMVPNEKLYTEVERGVEDYFDAHEKLATAKVLNALQSYLHDAETGKSQKNPHKELGNVLSDVLDKVSDDVQKVVDTESTRAKNYSTLDAIGKISAVVGVSDPVVYFAGPVDGHTCDNCLKFFFLEDKKTPRVWKVSELKNGYFKKGDITPCVGALHPHCRHALCSILPGYGFKNGKLEFIEPGYDVFKEQRG